MRGRSGQGSDRTGRAHPLTLLLFLFMVLVIQMATLVRGSLREPRLRAAVLTHKFPHFTQILTETLVLEKPRWKSSARLSRISTMGPLRLSTSGARGRH